MEIQKVISSENNRKQIGKNLKVVVDNYKEGSYYGRTEFDSPEIDNEVIFTSKKRIKTGRFCHVEITDALEYDLIGIVR
jgi:ribosomal protein S12 methylthiotransferase